jgi:hypothetical protein
MMAWASAELSADYLAWMADDKPLLLGENHARNPDFEEWHNNGGGFPEADITHADGPISYAYDGYTDLQTYTAAGTNRYLCFAWSTAVDFDTVALVGTNIPSSSVTSISLQIADDNTYSTNLSTIASWTPSASDAPRRLFADLHHTGSNPRLYTSVAYFRFAFITCTPTPPYIGEVFIGTRRQMKTNPFGAWDRMQLKNRQTLVEAAGGPLTKYVYNAGRRQIRARFGPHEDDTIADLVGLHRDDTSWGEYPFLWCDEPTSDAAAT